MTKNVHILPTDKPSRIWVNNLKRRYELEAEPLIGSNTAMHIYITSDEEIKKRDWYFNPKTNKVNKVGHYGHYGYSSKKIILTTDQDLIKDGVQAIDDEFLEWFVKNPSCEWVEVEKYFYEVGNDFDYEIILPQEGPKQAPFLEADNIDGQWLSFIPEERAWQEENLKKIFENYPNGYPKWSYLNGLILLGLKRIEIINKKNQ
jgi:hypothetical protein